MAARHDCAAISNNYIQKKVQMFERANGEGRR